MKLAGPFPLHSTVEHNLTLLNSAVPELAVAVQAFSLYRSNVRLTKLNSLRCSASLGAELLSLVADIADWPVAYSEQWGTAAGGRIVPTRYSNVDRQTRASLSGINFRPATLLST